MARIRSIKPELWSSPGIETLDPYARLLYIAMWNWADDNGVGVANPRELLGFAFPLDEELTVVDLRRWLVEITRVFGVKFYTVAGRAYYSIPSWEKHQKFDRRSKGKYPGPEEADTPENPENTREKGHSTETHESTPNTRRDSVAGTGEQGNRGTGEQTLSSDADASDAEIPDEPEDESEAFPEHVYELCEYLAEAIKRNGNKVGTVGARWYQSMDRLVRLDGYTPDQVRQVIDWSQANEFWQGNILSAAKLREKFDQLKSKMLYERNNPPKTGNRATDRMIAGYQAMSGYTGTQADPWTRKAIGA